MIFINFYQIMNLFQQCYTQSLISTKENFVNSDKFLLFCITLSHNFYTNPLSNNIQFHKIVLQREKILSHHSTNPFITSIFIRYLYDDSQFLVA